MSRSIKPLTLGLSGIALAACALGFAPSASAFTFSNGTVGVDTTDINKSFTVKFDGNVSTQTVSGLTSEAQFKFLGFTPTTTSVTTGKGKNAITTILTQTIAQFEVILKNTSSGAIGSRVSALGFNTDKEEVAASASGLFSGGLTGRSLSLPNQFGNVDVCYTDGNTCQGGQNGGVNNNQSLPGTFQQGTFMANVTLSGAVNSFTLSNLGVRYQSISGTSLGTSGTGRSVLFVPPDVPPPPPKKVPEPGIMGALAITGLAAARYKKQKSQTQTANA
jgi:hypothetical protein